MKIKDSFTDKIFMIFSYIVVALIVFICIYPLWLVIIYSVSNPDLVNAGKVFFWPKEINLDGYRQVFSRGDLMKGYWNTITQTLAVPAARERPIAVVTSLVLWATPWANTPLSAQKTSSSLWSSVFFTRPVIPASCTDRSSSRPRLPGGFASSA